ncbi:MAG: hypothetical protein ACI4Q3_05830 [Kiritimatiellia bacterium]
MIVPMKHVTVLCVAAAGTKTLEALRELGCVHLDLAAAVSDEMSAAAERLADAARAVQILVKAAEAAGRDVPPADAFAGVSDGDLVAAVLKADETCKALSEEIDRLEAAVRTYEPYGDFDPALARSLLDRGIDLSAVCTLPQPLPEERLSATRRRLADARARRSALAADLASARPRVAAIVRACPGLQDEIDFAAARNALATAGAVSYIGGWVPEDAAAAVRARARAEGWALLVRDAQAGENPPTLIRPPKLFRPVVALFKGLGVVPAYAEADVSVPFMCYFSLFFAMLVGDGAYGAIFLAGTLALRRKLTRSWFVLLTVFSCATIGWGLLSNTWFGAGIPWCANWPTVRWLADPSYHNVMLLCFTIGVSHLMLARIWNGICKAPDTTCLAEFGWAGVLLLMYLVTNSIVGIFPGVPGWGLVAGGLSIAAVFLFTVKPSELKTRAAELGMLPLNIMSALGDVISYVRLFAVGLASVKVAENFNAMATGLLDAGQAPWLNAVMAVAMVAILVVGHGLNLAMAALSILVHAVRLNTLEFSNHKGVSWSGYAFHAFARNGK